MTQLLLVSPEHGDPGGWVGQVGRVGHVQALPLA